MDNVPQVADVHFRTERIFFEVLQRVHASFRVVAGDSDYSFDLRDVELAAQRTDASRSEAQDVPSPESS